MQQENRSSNVRVPEFRGYLVLPPGSIQCMETVVLSYPLTYELGIRQQLVDEFRALISMV